MNLNGIANSVGSWPRGVVASALVCLSVAGCQSHDEGSPAPPPATVVQAADMNLITIDKNDVPKFPLVTADRIETY